MSLVYQAVLWSWMPGAFWLAYVESRAPQRSSWSRLILTFLAGAVSVSGVFAFHHMVEIEEPERVAPLLVYLCTVVGLLEEACKLLAVLLVGWPRRDFREAWDGLACASTAALGFATAENFLYVMGSGEINVLVGRSLSATFAHVAMSGIWGYALGLAKQRQGGLGVVLEAVFWSAVFHGLYDWFLMVGWAPGAVLVFAGLALVFRQRLQESYYTSARRQAPSEVVRECRSCRSLGRQEYVYCPHCGSPERAEKTLCLQCLAECPAEAGVCPACSRPVI